MYNCLCNIIYLHINYNIMYTYLFARDSERFLDQVPKFCLGRELFYYHVLLVKLILS